MVVISTRCVTVKVKKGRRIWDVCRWQRAGIVLTVGLNRVRGEKRNQKQHLGVGLELQDRSVIIFHQKPFAI